MMKCCYERKLLNKKELLDRNKERELLMDRNKERESC